MAPHTPLFLDGRALSDDDLRLNNGGVPHRRVFYSTLGALGAAIRRRYAPSGRYLIYGSPPKGWRMGRFTWQRIRHRLLSAALHRHLRRRYFGNPYYLCQAEVITGTVGIDQLRWRLDFNKASLIKRASIRVVVGPPGNPIDVSASFPHPGDFCMLVTIPHDETVSTATRVADAVNGHATWGSWMTVTPLSGSRSAVMPFPRRKRIAWLDSCFPYLPAHRLPSCLDEPSLPAAIDGRPRSTCRNAASRVHQWRVHGGLHDITVDWATTSKCPVTKPKDIFCSFADYCLSLELTENLAPQITWVTSSRMSRVGGYVDALKKCIASDPAFSHVRVHDATPPPLP